MRAVLREAGGLTTVKRDRKEWSGLFGLGSFLGRSRTQKLSHAREVGAAPSPELSGAMGSVVLARAGAEPSPSGRRFSFTRSQSASNLVHPARRSDSSNASE